MKRPSVYSGRDRTRGATSPQDRTRAARQSGTPAPTTSALKPEGKLRARLRRHERALLFVGGLLGATLIAALFWARQPQPREFIQEDIDAAVMHTVQTKTLPSQAARAAEAVRESVVRVNGYTDVEEDAEDDNEKSARSGGGDQKDHKDGAPEDSAKKNQKPAKLPNVFWHPGGRQYASKIGYKEYVRKSRRVRQTGKARPDIPAGFLPMGPGESVSDARHSHKSPPRQDERRCSPQL